VRARLRMLESMAHPPIMSPERIEVIEKQIQELYDKFSIIEKEFIEPLRRLQEESNSNSK
tara:strand:- start:657 stop:836 length:180 start_codon:yes stop_codon:yes gene_type:complete